MTNDYELEITVRGPSETHETSYGPRTDRHELARLRLPLTPKLAWDIYGEAGSRASAEDVARAHALPGAAS